MLPSPSDLQYFIEVSASLNLSRAAERLGLSQPSLSLAIQRLEHAVGTPVLIRGQKGVLLTPAGKQLLVQARSLMQQWEAVRASALSSVNQVQGRFSVGCHPSVAMSTLGNFFPDLMEEFPRLELKLVHDLSRRITESVIRMELDLGIVVNPVRHSDLVIQHLGEDEVTFWVSDGKRKCQDYRSGEAVLICDPELAQAQDLIKQAKRSGIRFSRFLPTSNLEVAADLVGSGAGIGILPHRVIAKVSDHRVKRIPRAPVVRDEFAVLYRVESKKVRAIREIAERAKSAF